MKTKVRALSGAADEIGFLFGVVDQDVNEKFIAEHGISSGAIIQFVRMCGDWDKARELILTFNTKKHVFGYNPFSARGIMIAIKSIIKNESGLWSYNKLEKTLRSVTNANRYRNYKGCPVWVGVTDNKAKYYDVRIDKGNDSMSYEKALNAVIQSSSVQLVVKSRDNRGDGGLVNHIGSEFLAEVYNTSNLVSVFARTKDFCKPVPKKFLKKIGWVLNTFFYNISRNNETESDKICEKYGNDHKKIFMKRDVIEGMFSIKPEDNKELYEMGLNAD